MSTIGELVEKLVGMGVSVATASEIVAQSYAAGVASASTRSSGAERQRRYVEKKKASQNDGLASPDDRAAPASQNDEKRHEPSLNDASAVGPLTTSISSSKKPKSANSARASRGTRINPDWKPSPEDRARARATGLSESDVDREAIRFVNHFVAKSGAKGVMLDWQATWHNWVIRAAEFKGVAPVTPAGTSTANDSRVFIKTESHQWLAWQEYLKRTRGKGSPYDRQSDGWWFDSEWPPGHQSAA